MEKTDLLRKTKNLIRLYKFFPKKRLGQNFSINSEILKRLISYGSLNKNDVILEIGPGFGFLTELLARHSKKVIAVEFDPELVNFLKRELYKLSNVEIIKGDILKISLPLFNKVVAAPPYSISSPLLFRIFKSKFDCAILILQKEFAERMVAPVGTRDYSRLSVNIYYKAKVELLENVSKNMFYPKPDVDSIIVRLTPRSPPFNVIDEDFFFETVRTLFNQRNKKIRNSLNLLFRKYEVSKQDSFELCRSIPFNQERIKDLTPETIGIISNKLFIELEKRKHQK